jgi:hypothetical protein
VVVHTCNPSTQECELGGSRVGSQPELHIKTLSQKKTKVKRGTVAYNADIILSLFKKMTSAMMFLLGKCHHK